MNEHSVEAFVVYMYGGIFVDIAGLYATHMCHAWPVSGSNGCFGIIPFPARRPVGIKACNGLHSNIH